MAQNRDLVLTILNGKIGFHFNNKLNNFSFIPYCYRNVGGEWFDISSIGDVIVVDRQRLMELIEETGSSFQFSLLASDKLLTNWIRKKRSINCLITKIEDVNSSITFLRLWRI